MWKWFSLFERLKGVGGRDNFPPKIGSRARIQSSVVWLCGSRANETHFHKRGFFLGLFWKWEFWNSEMTYWHWRGEGFPDFSQFYIFPFCHESLWSFLDRDKIHLFHVSHVIGYWFVRFDTRERNVSLLRLPLFIFQFCVQCPGHWIEVRLEVTFFLLFMCKSCFSHANKPANRIMYMSPPSSLLFKGQDTEHTTVELSFVASNHNYDFFYCQIQEATISTGLVKSVGCNLWLALTYCLDIYPCTL